ncbi:MAG TPA: HD domain-containing phosphohydrolase [Gemmatimonadaceae bacterium]|nr:HD domain-containing phosphohydrolase [Gemmatimonadaceae bacterium]
MTSAAVNSEPTAPPRATAQIRILVVDDEDTIRLVLAKYLRTRGFDVATAESGDAALETLSGAKFDLMLCDVRMPGLSGVEIVVPALELDPDLGIVMLSAVNDAPTATEAMAHGVLDYLTKPIELSDLHDAVQRALHKRTLLREQRRVERAIREEVAERTQELEMEKAHLRDLTVTVVETLVAAMEARDVFQRGHSARVAELAASIAEYMGLSPEVVEDVRIAGRLHDVGNIGIRDDVLNKPGALNPDEFAHVKDHVRIGVEILTPLRHIERAITFVADHHEHFDGSGYPATKSGEAISIGGRILAAADAFDAMTSRRPYREPRSPEEAVIELQRHSGSLMDPRVFEALRVVVKRRKSLIFIDAIHG